MTKIEKMEGKVSEKGEREGERESGVGNLLRGISKDLHLCRNLSSLTVERERVVNEDSRNVETVGEGERERERDRKLKISHSLTGGPLIPPRPLRK